MIRHNMRFNSMTTDKSQKCEMSGEMWMIRKVEADDISGTKKLSFVREKWLSIPIGDSGVRSIIKNKGYTMMECCEGDQSGPEVFCSDSNFGSVSLGSAYIVLEHNGRWSGRHLAERDGFIDDGLLVSIAGDGKQPEIKRASINDPENFIFANEMIFDTTGKESEWNTGKRYKKFNYLFFIDDDTFSSKSDVFSSRYHLLNTGGKKIFKNDGKIILTPKLQGCCIKIKKTDDGVRIHHELDCKTMGEMRNTESEDEVIFFPYMTTSSFVVANIRVLDQCVEMTYLTLGEEFEALSYSDLAGLTKKELVHKMPNPVYFASLKRMKIYI